MPPRQRRKSKSSPPTKKEGDKDAPKKQSENTQTAGAVAVPKKEPTQTKKESFLYKPVPILQRKRFVIIYGIAIGALVPFLFGYISIKHIKDTMDMMGVYVRDSHESFEASRKIFNENYYTYMDVLDMYVKNSHETFEASRSLLSSNIETLQLRRLMDFTPSTTNTTYGNLERPGEILSKKGLRVKHPVVMIPGIVTTGLELWQGEECAKKYFRQRMWGTMTMVQNILFNTRCWIKHMALNASTGTDQEGIKLRPAQGFEAADFVLGGYWVWSKLIENLADLGYDPGTMHMASFDWRLGFRMLEERDMWLSKLTRQIETMVKTNGEKAVIVTHSMGGNLFLYFMQWVQKHRDDKWVDQHIEAFCSVATPFLGTPKGVSALLSGEAKDTAEMGVMGSVLDHHISPFERRKLFRSWESTLTMIPKGGNRVWGGGGWKVIDVDDERVAEMAEHILHFEDDANMTTDESVNFLLYNTTSNTTIDGNLMRYVETYTHGFRTKPFTGAPDDVPEGAWLNMLEHQLPRAPNMKIYAMYGVGKESERAYFYAPASRVSNKTISEAVPMRDEVTWLIDKNKNEQNITFGMVKTDGDGSVPVLSLGFASARAWKTKHFNPAGVKVVTREYFHNPVSMLQDVRGGPGTADHVDIMGNHEMLQDILRVAAGAPVEEVVYSKIREISERVPLPPELV